MGLFLLLTVGVGWAKPVPVDMRNFRNPKAGMAATALAGPISNFLLALVCISLGGFVLRDGMGRVWSAYVLLFLCQLAVLNVGLGVFNLIPIPPLDGSRVVSAFLPDRAYRYIHPKEDLRKAMGDVLARSDNKLPPPVAAFQGIVGREPYPVAEKAAEIIQRLVHLGVTRFRALFRGNRSRSEVVATFIAVLELCKAHRLRLAGTEEDCTVTCIQGEEAQPLDITADAPEE